MNGTDILGSIYNFLDRKKARTVLFFYIIAVILNVPYPSLPPLTVMIIGWTFGTLVFFIVLLFVWYGIPWIAGRGKER